MRAWPWRRGRDAGAISARDSGCAVRGAGVRGADYGPVVRASEGGQGDDLLAAVCRVPALGVPTTLRASSKGLLLAKRILTACLSACPPLLPSPAYMGLSGLLGHIVFLVIKL
jgi:hypothetical protein